MIETNGENYQIFCQQAKEIDDRLDRIYEDVKYHSSLTPTRKHECFKQLVDMGTKIIPYVFHKMTQHGCHWTHLLLLRELVGDQMKIPAEHQGQFTHIMTDWLIWYLDSSYYNHDVYYGLVNELNTSDDKLE